MKTRNTEAFIPNPQMNLPSAIRYQLRKWALVALFSAAYFRVPPLAAADANPPDRLTYQGYLVDSNGPLGNPPKNYDVVFRIYLNADATGLKWSEQQTITVDNGSFSVLLGDGTVFPGEGHPALSTVFTGSDASDRFIGVTVSGIGPNGGAAEVLPRLRMLTAPYSYLAAKAVTAGKLVNDSNGQVVTVVGSTVGINTALPGTALDVNGVVTATGAAINGDETISGNLNFGPGARQMVNLSGTPFGIGVQNSTFYSRSAGAFAWFKGGTHVFNQFDPGAGGSALMTLGDDGLHLSTGSLYIPNGGLDAGTLTIHSGIQLPGNSILELGAGLAGKDPSAGRIVYGFYSTALNIVGAGQVNAVRNIRLFDQVGIGVDPATSLDIGGPLWRNLTVRGSGGSDVVVIGNNGKATVSAQNQALNAFADLSLNPGGKVTLGLTGGGGTPARPPSPNGLNPINLESRNSYDFGDGLTIGGLKDNVMAIQTFINAHWDDRATFQTFQNVLALQPEAGRVVIGAGTPLAPLHVFGTALTDFFLEAYLDPFGAADAQNVHHTELSHSIAAEGRVRAAAFDVNSDARIKEISGRTDPGAALEAVKHLQITDYHYVDKISSGSRGQRGVIAQEVEQFMPEAVTRSGGFIPNIFAPAFSSEYRAAQRSVKIELNKEHCLRKGETVVIYIGKERKETEVMAIPSPTSFEVGSESPLEKVFVYGKKVDDFRSVDYDRLFSTGLAAIQELSRQVDSLKASQARIAELEIKAARAESLEVRVAQLEKLFAQLSAKEPAPAPVELGQSKPLAIKADRPQPHN
jgi:hypothetical protein